MLSSLQLNISGKGVQVTRMYCTQWGKFGESPTLSRNGNELILTRSPITRLYL